MERKKDSRRTRIAAIGLLAVLVALAGCSSLGLGGDATGVDAVEQVPSGVDTVVRVDAAVMTDEATRQLADRGADDVGMAGGPSNVSQARSEFENETGLDPAEADELVAYQKRTGGVGSAEYLGVVVHADWDRETVVEAVTADETTEYENETYNGKTVYVSTNQYGSTDDAFAVLADGQFVFGSERAVKDAVDVETGEADAFDGSLRAAYDDTRDGLVTFATSVPAEDIPRSAGGSVDVSQYRDVRTVTGVYYTSSNSVGVELRLVANGTEAAKDVHDVTDGGLSIATGYTENETAKETLRAVEVERDGDVVTVSYEESVDTLREILDYYEERGA